VKPRFGIVGCGKVARFHINGLKKAGAKIVHISDKNDEAAVEYVSEFGCWFSSDYHDLLADPAVSVVSVLTNTKSHHDICLAALEAGKDVICEKTMTDNANEAEEVARIAMKCDHLFYTGYTKRFYPAVRKAKELLPSLGRLFSAHVRTYQPWGNYYERRETAGLVRVLEDYGGAVVKYGASHMIDMILYFLGRPQSVYGVVDFVAGSGFDRSATALLEYADGLIVNLEAVAHPIKRIGYGHDSWEEYIQINGVNGRLEMHFPGWDHPESHGVLLIHYDNAHDSPMEYRFDPVNPFDLEIEYFCECLEKKHQGYPDMVDGFNVDLLIEALMESARRKTALKLDWCGIDED